MRVKPFLIRDLAALVLVLAMVSCRNGGNDSSAPDAAATPSTSASASALPLSPLSSIVGDPARLALEANRALAEHLRREIVRPDDPDYLKLRRALAAGAPLWRRREMLAGEVIFGPLRSVDESGGAISRLDSAIVQEKPKDALAELETIAAPLRLFAETAKRPPFANPILARVVSSAAYDLGSMAIESMPGLADGLPGVIADCQGTLDFIEKATNVLAEIDKEKTKESRNLATSLIASLRSRLDGAATSGHFDDRAAFVSMTGKLGMALRQLSVAVALETKLPYQPRIAVGKNDTDEPVSALTIPAFRRSVKRKAEHQAYVDLGRALFFDSRLSSGNSRSCASCHIPEKALADGVARPKSLDPAVTLRHTPSLLYGSLQAAFLWDGRLLTAERQALGVIHAKAEMGLTDAEMVQALDRAEDLRPLFAALSTNPSPDLVGRALATFQAEMFVPANAPIDKFARGDEAALSDAARAGFDVFVGKARCARCHIPPFFGGSRPRDFATPVFAVLGVPTAPGATSLDPDRGRGAVTNRPADESSFKTPTVRNIVRTAPYFHNGAFKTLEQVVDFYDLGGGRGMGLSVPNQDPDVRKLGLSEQEKRSLLLFLRDTLADEDLPDKRSLRGSSPR